MKVNLLLLVAFSAVFFTTCKKGEKDPAFSIYSRKARVVGEWRVESGNSTLRDDSQLFLQTIGYESGTASIAITSNGIVGNGTEKYAYTFKFEKDGKVTIYQRIGNDAVSINGSWNFSGGIGDLKNKEQIIIHYNSYWPQIGKYTFAGNAYDITYDLIELRNKKIVMKTYYKEDDLNGTTISFSEELTLKQ